MDQIESILQRPKLYNNVDGVGELGMGVMLFGFALLMWLQVHSPGSAIWHKVYVVLPLILLIGSIIDQGSKAIKRHITYRRTGFVEYRKRDNVWLGAIACVTSALVAVGIAFAARSHWSIGSHLGLTTPAALLGLAFAAAYAYGVARSVRWKWIVAAVIAICSVVIAMLPADWAGAIVGSPSNAGPFSPGSVGAWLVSILTYGTILLVSGAISFWLYLRHTQPPARTAE
jgi:hypothetical protein